MNLENIMILVDDGERGSEVRYICQLSHVIRGRGIKGQGCEVRRLLYNRVEGIEGIKSTTRGNGISACDYKDFR